jgi:hypothetical protein
LIFVLAQARTESWKIGGNALKIIDYTIDKEGCPQIIAHILRVDNPQNYRPSTISDNANYALLHIYRLDGPGFELNYDLRLTNHDLHVEDLVVARSKNNWQETVKIEKSGSYTLWADSTEKARAPLNITLGNEYYVRSSVAFDAESSVTLKQFVALPQLTLMDNVAGRIESQTVRLQPRDYQRFRFAINGGLGFRTYVIPQKGYDIDSRRLDVKKRLRFGFQCDLGATYFFSESKGVGFKFNGFLSSTEIQTKLFIHDVSRDSRQFYIDAQTIFAGPTFTYRFVDRFLHTKNTFLIDFGLGYLKHQEEYRENYQEDTYYSMIDHRSLGFCTSFGYDIWLTRTTALGFQLGFVGGVEIFKTTRSNPFYQDPLTHIVKRSRRPGRIDLSVGLRF